jgi:hypothetical protein
VKAFTAFTVEALLASKNKKLGINFLEDSKYYLQQKLL